MRSLHVKVTVLATVITALLLGAATVLVAYSLRDQIEQRSTEASRIAHICTYDGCTPIEVPNQAFYPRSGANYVRYASTSIQPQLSLWPLSNPDKAPFTLLGEGPPRPDPRGGVAAAQDELNYSVLTVSGIALSITMLVGLMVFATAGRVLRPVEAMRQELAEINENNLTRRVPVPDMDNEIMRLAVTINETMDRVHRAMEDTRRFVADASHELRSPLAALRAELEIALSHPQLADWPAVVGNALEDTERLQELTTDLLLLARLDADGTLREEPVDLTAVVQREVLRRRLTEIELVTDVEARPVLVAGRRAQLSRLLGNLLDNAERHASSTVTVRLRGGPEAVLEVTDDGPGIPLPDRDRVFDRFTRLDDARTRDAGGAGLGLAIARRIASRHHGTLEAADATDFHGIRFVATLPTGEPAQAPASTLAASTAPQRTGDDVWQFVNGAFVAVHAPVPEPREPVHTGLELSLIFGEHEPVPV